MRFLICFDLKSNSSRCKRLGLTSIAYLWNRDQKELLKEMIDNGMKSVIIKTACYGLKPEKCLGKSIEELYPMLMELVIILVSSIFMKYTRVKPIKLTFAGRVANTKH